LKTDHITICICTYKRPDMLKKLLSELNSLRTESLFTISVNIVDNDFSHSAEAVVNEFIDQTAFPIKYMVEPQRSITLARNRGIEHTDSMIAFIDDDEFPRPDWLLNLYKTLKEKQVAGVLGPVIPHFDNEPENWIVKSKLCERVSFQTGHILHWTHTRTGNVLLSKEVMKDKEATFLPRFGTGGGDVDFFKRLMLRGHIFLWCNEGVVFERVPLKRQKREYFCKRAMLQGSNSLRYAFSSHEKKEKIILLIKTASAIVLYSLSLPILRIAGDHIFMKYLVKDCHHIGRLMSMAGISIIKKRDI